MTARDRLAAIAARADAATEGPWWWSAERPTVGVVAKRESGDLGGGPSLVAETWTLRSNRAANAEFIAESRQDVPDLVATLRAVLDLHEQYAIPVLDALTATPNGICDHDGAPWPCPTVAAIDTALGGAS